MIRLKSVDFWTNDYVTNTHITENIQQTLQVDIRPSKRSIFLKFVLWWYLVVYDMLATFFLCVRMANKWYSVMRIANVCFTKVNINESLWPHNSFNETSARIHVSHERSENIFCAIYFCQSFFTAAAAAALCSDICIHFFSAMNKWLRGNKETKWMKNTKKQHTFSTTDFTVVYFFSGRYVCIMYMQ